MAHKFDPTKIALLENSARLNLFPPKETFQKLGLREGMTVIDVGTGTGFYLPYLAEVVGEKGKVYGVDIEPKFLEYAQKKVSNLGLKNVELLLSEENFIPLPESSVDFAFLIFVFHELLDPIKFLKNLKVLCRKEGKMVIIDWKKEPRDMGPPPEEVYAEEEVLSLLQRGDLTIESRDSLSSYCFAIVAKL